MASKKKPSKSKSAKKPSRLAARPAARPAAPAAPKHPAPPPKLAKPLGPSFEDARVFLELVNQTFTPHFALAREWFLGRFEAKDLNDFNTKYPEETDERARFFTVCGWFETAGVLMKNRLLNPDLFFDRYAVGPFWNKSKVIIHALQKESGQKELLENFEWLSRKELAWHKSREKV